jgi:Ca2+-binding EF-hand superfamily protein
MVAILSRKISSNETRNFFSGEVLVWAVRAKAPHINQAKNKIMKTKSLIIVAASLGLLGAAHAQEPKKDRPQQKLPPEIIEKFDKDGDGKLNEEERAAARAVREEMMKNRKKEMLEKFDTNKDGSLDDTEKAAAKEAHKQMALEKFDKDGDGELSDAEKAEMRKAMSKRPGGPGKKKGSKAEN